MLKLCCYLLLFFAMILSGSSLNAQDEFTTIKSSSNWVLEFSDPCTENWENQWFLDGEIATVDNSEKGMNFKAGPMSGNDAHHAVLWTKKSFKGDVKIEYSYTRTDSQRVKVNILYVQATGIEKGPYKKDIYKWNELRTVPAMRTYFNYMKTLHISYAAFNTNNDDSDADYIRVRQYPVTETITFNDMAIPPDYFNTGLFLPGKTYKVTVIKTKEKLFFTIDHGGETQTFSWDLDKLKPITEGRIGLRHMYTRSANYSDFNVWVR